MGVGINYVFSVPPEQCEEAFYQTTLRLMSALHAQCLRIGREEIPVDQAAERLRHKLEDGPFKERRSFSVGFGYCSRYGEDLAMQLSLHARRYSEISREFDGSIPFSTLMGDYWENGSWPDKPFWALSYPTIAPEHEEFWYAAWRAAENLETVLLHAVNAPAGEVRIPHAAVRYDESGWYAPYHVRMMYHADVTEFAQDFVRFFIEGKSDWWPLDVTFDKPPSMVLDEAISKGLMFEDKSVRVEECDPCNYDGPSEPVAGEMTAFVSSLDRERAERIAQADAATVERSLHEAASLTRDVTVKQTAGGGWLVGTHLFNSLYEFYVALGLLLDDDTARAPR